MAAILIWGAPGPLFGYSDTWQLVINTATTIITFLMVFVIQNTQNRDTAAMQIKLDELIRVTRKARNMLLDLEELDDQELEKLRQDYERLGAGEVARHRRSACGPCRKRRRADADIDAVSGKTDAARTAGKADEAESCPSASTKTSPIKDEDGGARLSLLDGKPVRTPGKAPLVLPTLALAEAVADEWRAQGERIDPATMPLTKLANSAIDGVLGPRAGGDRRHSRLRRLGPPLLPRARTARSGRGASEALGPRARLGQGRAGAPLMLSARASFMSPSREPRSTGSRRRSQAATRSAWRRCMS